MAGFSQGMVRTSRQVAWVIAIGCLGGLLPAQAAEKYSEAAVKAAFIHRFSGYVDWPGDVAATRLTIAVMGDAEVASQLEALVARQSSFGRPTEVVRATKPAELGAAQIVYLGTATRREVRNLIAAVATRPVLTVTDDERGLDQGATVNFLVVDRRVRFEVSLTAAQRAGLRISSDMLSVATRVVGNAGQ